MLILLKKDDLNLEFLSQVICNLHSNKVYSYDGTALGSKQNIDFTLISTNSLTDYVGLDDPDVFDENSFIITKFKA